MTAKHSNATTRWLLASVASLTCAAVHAASGSWSSNGPFGGNVNAFAIYEAAPSTVYATGSGVFRSVNSGTSWQRIEIGVPQPFYASHLEAATIDPVVYVGNRVRVYRSGNAGDLWIPVAALPPGVYFNDMSLRRGTSNSIALAASDGVYLSSNGGSTWTGPTLPTTSVRLETIEYAADGSLYVGVRNPDPGFFAGAMVIRSIDGGASWAATPSQPVFFNGPIELVSSPADPQFLVASNGVEISVSSDGGVTWSARSLPAAVPGCGNVLAIALHPGSVLEAFVACRNLGVHRTTSFNLANPVWNTWSVANGLTVNGTDPVQASRIGVHPAFPATPTLWVGTNVGGLFRSTNAGTNWSAINNGYQSVNIRALAAHPVDTGPGTVVLAGQGDSFTTARAILRSPDSGMSWEPALSGLNAEQIRSIAIDPTTVDNNPLTTEPFTAYAAGKSELLPTLAPKDGGIYKSTDGGNSWTTIDNGMAIVGDAPDMGTIRTVAIDPRSCATPPVSGPCPIGSGPLQTLFIAGSGRTAPGDLTAPLVSARIYKSVNAGSNWSPSDNGLPLGQNLGAPGSGLFAVMGGVNPVVFDPSNTQTVYIGTFISTADDPDNGIFSTIPNGVFKSTDGGANWVHMSTGLPRYNEPGGSHLDVLAMAINPANPQILYAGASRLTGGTISGSIYKTLNGGANWFEASAGIAGQDVRALLIDPADASGNTVYAGTGGTGANPGGVFRSTDGGVTWNSYSIGLPAYSSTALAMPARSVGAAPRLLAGTNAGIWDYTALPDGDADGAPTAMENSVLAGDGNGDGIPDANQSAVASLSAPASVSGAGIDATALGSVSVTIEIVPSTGGCTQLNDSSSLQSTLFPPDSAGNGASHEPWGLVKFALPACAAATVRVTFHGASFGPDWTWRNYGPRVPGDVDSFGWYSFAGAQRIDAQTWELTIDATRQGNYRDDANNILFIGGPAQLPGLIFANGFD